MSRQLTTVLKRQEKLSTKIERLEKRVREIEEVLKAGGIPHKEPASTKTGTETLGIIELLELPDNLRKTALAMSALGEATAEEVAIKTGRTRNIESVYLNQLARVRYLEKARKGKKVFFKVKGSLEKRLVEIAGRLIR
ncbi:MAG: hypothetical protein ACE5Z5_04590 [Candidatus Bathyarchaeia archaeon]